jgi:hypothetical protein
LHGLDPGASKQENFDYEKLRIGSLYIVSRDRTCRDLDGDAVTGAGNEGHEQNAEARAGQYGKDAKKQARKVLRHQRSRQE